MFRVKKRMFGVEKSVVYKLAVKDDQLMVTIQQQRGPEDCGLYSIETAYDAALHKEHHTVTYKQEEM